MKYVAHFQCFSVLLILNSTVFTICLYPYPPSIISQPVCQGALTFKLFLSHPQHCYFDCLVINISCQAHCCDKTHMARVVPTLCINDDSCYINISSRRSTAFRPMLVFVFMFRWGTYFVWDSKPSLKCLRMPLICITQPPQHEALFQWFFLTCLDHCQGFKFSEEARQ